MAADTMAANRQDGSKTDKMSVRMATGLTKRHYVSVRPSTKVLVFFFFTFGKSISRGSRKII